MRQRSNGGPRTAVPAPAVVLAAATATVLAAGCGAAPEAAGRPVPPATSLAPPATALVTPEPGPADTSPAPAGNRAEDGGDGGDADGAGVTVVATGDISPRCSAGPGCAARATSDLALRLAPDAVLALGDLQYPAGALRDFRAYYDRTWGRLKDITRPVPGNHEYITAGAAGYFRYFGDRARPQGRSYYGFDLGGWHLVALDSSIPHGPGSPQLEWLTADLAANPRPCTLAYWHHPRFSSGSVHGNDPDVGPFWRELAAAGADVVLGGHDHVYERFAPLRPDGTRAADGIRSFVAGGGGASRYAFGPPVRGSAFRDDGHHGVLRLVLKPGGYSWGFATTEGTVLDTGSARCH
ncbi:metallophosphoesterase family protein [Sphaerisporangium rufum]|nr:metallophosphoesterase [Sphaerisporangium rufum]